MIWLGWLIFALALAYASPSAERRALLLIAAGLCVTALGNQSIHPDAFWLFSAMVWVGMGALFATKGRNFALPALCLIASGLFKLPARLSGLGYEFGNVWLGFSDIAGIAAILFLGRPALAGLFDRVHRVGRGFGIGDNRRMARSKVR